MTRSTQMASWRSSTGPSRKKTNPPRRQRSPHAVAQERNQNASTLMYALPIYFSHALIGLVHGLREAQRRGQAKAHLWPWSRMTAFRRVQEVIAAAGIPDGPHACPKGLRHGFGVQ